MENFVKDIFMSLEQDDKKVLVLKEKLKKRRLIDRTKILMSNPISELLRLTKVNCRISEYNNTFGNISIEN